MPGANFSRIKNWDPEVLTNTDLNAEIDNILANLNPAGIDDYSTNATQMQIQTAPGDVGSESLATSIGGELERLRYVIARMIGTDVDYWYEEPPTSFSDLIAAIGSGGLPPNRIASCATSLRSSQPLALIPNGAAASLTLAATAIPFVYYIGGVRYEASADVVLTGLGLAPSSTNTATANLPNTALDTAATQQTKFIGQYGTTLYVDAMGAEVSSRVGQIAAFKAGSSEYFLAYIKSTTELTNCVRGCFWNSSSAAVPAEAIADNETLTLLRLTWVFINTDGDLVVSYTNPVIGGNQPSTPATGDYWYDTSVDQWKIYNSVAYVDAQALLIGICAQDTANCVAARTFDTYGAFSNVNNIAIDRNSATQAKVRQIGGEISVYGTGLRFGNHRPVWDITSHLDTGLVEASNTYYYCYIKETGATVLSDQAPTDRRDLQGLYHPTEAWRCVGWIWNDTSSDFLAGGTQSFNGSVNPFTVMGSSSVYGDYQTWLNTTHRIFHDCPDMFKHTLIAAQEWPTTSGAIANLASLVLTPGIWNVTFRVTVMNNGAVTATDVLLGISMDPTSATFLDAYNGYNRAYFNVPTTSGEKNTFELTVPVRVTYRDATIPGLTVYGKVFATTVGANLEIFAGFLYANRLDSPYGAPA